MAARKAHHAREEEEMRRRWAAGQKEIMARVEGGIRWEEARVQAILDKERKEREEVERRQKEEEEKKRLAEEKRRAEDEKKRAEEEKERMEKEKDEEERVKQEAVVQARKAAEQAEVEERKALGLTTADEDWVSARRCLKVCTFSPLIKSWN